MAFIPSAPFRVIKMNRDYSHLVEGVKLVQTRLSEWSDGGSSAEFALEITIKETPDNPRAVYRVTPVSGFPSLRLVEVTPPEVIDETQAEAPAKETPAAEKPAKPEKPAKASKAAKTPRPVEVTTTLPEGVPVMVVSREIAEDIDPAEVEGYPR